MKKLLLFLFVFFLVLLNSVQSQTVEEKQKEKAIQKVIAETNTEKLKERLDVLKTKYWKVKKKIKKWADEKGVPIRKVEPNGKVSEI